jgi:hypothetical protein
MIFRNILFYGALLGIFLTHLVSAEPNSGILGSKDHDRSAHQKFRQVTKREIEADGRERFVTNTVIELRNGKNRFDESLQRWVEANERIELVNGAAVGRGTGHKVIFSGNLNDAAGTIDLLTPDKKRLRSQIAGIAYTEKSSGRSVFIAEITDSTGELHGESDIIYPKPFDSIDADVRYRHTLAGLEQDVIFREQLPQPEEFQFDSRETYLEIWTQFIEAPEPERTSHTIPRHQDKTQQDETLGFGEMEIIGGRAFDLGDEDKNVGIRVAKEWVTINGMTFLIESIPVTDIALKLGSLPERQVARLPEKVSHGLKVELAKAETGGTADQRRRPISLKEYKAQANSSEGTRFLAKANRPGKSRPGFLFDYVLVATTSGYTFAAGGTYYISGPVTETSFH